MKFFQTLFFRSRLKTFIATFLRRMAAPVFQNQFVRGHYVQIRSNVVFARFARIFTVDVLVRASGIILLPVYLRLMTAEEFGLYGYLASIINAFSLFINLGLYVAQIKLFSDYSEEDRGRLSFTLNSILLAFLLLLFAVCLIFKFDSIIASFLIRAKFDYDHFRPVIFAAVVLNVFGLMIYSYFMAAEKIHIIQRQNILRLILVNGLVIFLLYIGTGDKALGRIRYTNIAESMVLLAFGFIVVRAMQFRFSWAMAQRSIKLGLPVMLLAVVNVGYSLSDRFFLERNFDLKTVGVYNLGIMIAGIITFIMTSFQSVYGPIFLKEKNLSLAFRMFRQALKWASISFVACSVILVILMQALISLSVIGNEYAEVVVLLPLLLVVSSVMAVNQLYLNYTVYFETTHVGLIVGVFTNCINIVLNYFLVPRLGMYGAALSSLLAMCISLVTLHLYVEWKVKVKSLITAHAV